MLTSSIRIRLKLGELLEGGGTGCIRQIGNAATFAVSTRQRLPSLMKRVAAPASAEAHREWLRWSDLFFKGSRFEIGAELTAMSACGKDVVKPFLLRAFKTEVEFFTPAALKIAQDLAVPVRNPIVRQLLNAFLLKRDERIDEGTSLLR